MAEQKKVELQSDAIDKAFHISLILKGLNGLIEIIGGLLLLIIRPEQIDHISQRLTAGTLANDPGSFWAKPIADWASTISEGSIVFGSIYLLSHGIVKLFVVIQVWRNRSWAYPLLIIVIGLFLLYQLGYLIFKQVTFGMVALTIFDSIIIYLTVIEYKRHLKRHDFNED